MTTSESIAELAGALAKAQGEMEGAVKTSVNSFFKSRYSDLSSVWAACRASLAKYGLAVVCYLQTARINRHLDRLVARIEVARNDGMDYWDKHRDTEIEVRR